VVKPIGGFLQFIIMSANMVKSEQAERYVSLCDEGGSLSGYRAERILCDQLTEDFVSELRVTDSCETQRDN
jgi:hypothetical protein